MSETLDEANKAKASAAPARAADSGRVERQLAKFSRGLGRWYNRLFRDGFTVEDAVVYLLTGLFLVGFMIIFGRVQEREVDSLRTLSEDVIEQWKPVPMSEYSGWEDGALDMHYLGAQVAMTAMRYHQAGMTTSMNATGKNLGFVVGTFIVLLGRAVIVREVRGRTQLSVQLSQQLGQAAAASAEGTATPTMPASGGPGGTLDTTLPGVVMVVVGGAIVLATILGPSPNAVVEDDGIVCPLCGRAVVGSTEPATEINPVGSANDGPPAAGTQPSAEE